MRCSRCWQNYRSRSVSPSPGTRAQSWPTTSRSLHCCATECSSHSPAGPGSAARTRGSTTCRAIASQPHRAVPAQRSPSPRRRATPQQSAPQDPRLAHSGRRLPPRSGMPMIVTMVTTTPARLFGVRVDHEIVDGLRQHRRGSRPGHRVVVDAVLPGGSPPSMSWVPPSALTGKIRQDEAPSLSSPRWRDRHCHCPLGPGRPRVMSRMMLATSTTPRLRSESTYACHSE